MKNFILKYNNLEHETVGNSHSKMFEFIKIKTQVIFYFLWELIWNIESKWR